MLNFLKNLQKQAKGRRTRIERENDMETEVEVSSEMLFREILANINNTNNGQQALKELCEGVVNHKDDPCDDDDYGDGVDDDDDDDDDDDGNNDEDYEDGSSEDYHENDQEINPENDPNISANNRTNEFIQMLTSIGYNGETKIKLNNKQIKKTIPHRDDSNQTNHSSNDTNLTSKQLIEMLNNTILPSISNVDDNSSYMITIRLAKTPSFCSIYESYFKEQLQHSPFSLHPALFREPFELTRCNIAEFQVQNCEQLNRALKVIHSSYNHCVAADKFCFKKTFKVKGLVIGMNQIPTRCHDIFACLDDDKLSHLCNSISSSLFTKNFLKNDAKYLQQKPHVLFLSNRTRDKKFRFNGQKILDHFGDSFYGFINVIGIDVNHYFNKKNTLIDRINFH